MCQMVALNLPSCESPTQVRVLIYFSYDGVPYPLVPSLQRASSGTTIGQHDYLLQHTHIFNLDSVFPAIGPK